MRNVRLLLEYDGTQYVGWQRQENGRSIQGEIERVLLELTGRETSLTGAGRTDAGVHARGQVANFRTESTLRVEKLCGGLNALLPEDIVVLSADEVPLDFHARYSARWREYSYLITLRPSALLRQYSWYLRYRLDLESMHRLAEAIKGDRDFQAFSRSLADVPHHRCTVTEAAWRADGPCLRFRIRSNRFLHGMVRALVGTMVDVGRGYTPEENFARILVGRDRTQAGMSAPARGLTLESVIY